ncbi:MAG: type III pantothenate kinase [Bacteroidales bacterium]|jgi:type III pantothenate kinase|nr:type III pantothenate kinase [Bacteroidales bacterium]
MKLCIDNGNTRSKIAIFDNGKMLDYAVFSHILYANVAKTPDFLQEIFDCNALNIKSLIEKKDDVNYLGGVYGFHDNIGSDFLAMALYVHKTFPNTTKLVISLGTCITYGLILADGKFVGRAISPGVRMRAVSLHNFTDALPMVNIDTQQASTLHNYSPNTENAVTKGIMDGITGELQYHICHFKNNFPDGKVFFTGGDAEIFAPQMGVEIVNDMVLKGLNELEVGEKNDSRIEG